MAKTIPVAAFWAGYTPIPVSCKGRSLALTLLLVTASIFPLHAQYFVVSQLGGPVAITAPWRFHHGDNPQWASPSFDDSEWSLLGMDRPWNSQGYQGISGYGWYRIRLQVPASEEPLALGIPQKGHAEEIYADGKIIGTLGRMRPSPRWIQGLPDVLEVIPLSPTLYGRTIELAVRAWQSPLTAPFVGELSWPPPVLGTEQSIQASHELSLHRAMSRYLPIGIVALVALVIGQISFGLFLLRPRATEYAWAGLFLFGQALSPGFFIYCQVHEVPSEVLEPAIISISAVVTICGLFLIWRFIRVRADGFFWAAILAALVPPLSTLLVGVGLSTIPKDLVVRTLAALCFGFIVFIRLVREARQGNRDAQIFLVPFLLNNVMHVVGWIQLLLYWLGLHRLEEFSVRPSLELYKGPSFTFTWEDLGELLSYLAIGAVLVRRFTRSAEQEQRLATEMESARQVQAQLVPLDFPHLSGFQIDAAYVPAAEVGGDFYQVFTMRDGSFLIVIGDVCGKGLKAAMTGVLAIGVARTLASEQLHPGAFLTRFNREMVGTQNGGFITCACARITRDGMAAFANAGHLPPYRNGEEIELNSSLPLGITPDVDYAETCVQFALGDCLTFLSDGVVEARSKAGGGFFGFDRMRAISKQSAKEIANAAQQFGQEDDITVLTLSFTAPNAMHT